MNSQYKNQTHAYDLEERTARFSEEIIDLVKKVKKDLFNESIIKQLIRCGDSVGANYCEAINASSRKDFRNKIYICKKEVNEVKYFLRLLAKTNSEFKIGLRILWKEAQELNLIFQKIVNTINKGKK